MSEAKARPRLREIPRSIWALGLVSMFMDVSSEMIHALLPVFLVTTLGASTMAVGLIEGVAEATANIVKVFSGTLSDRLRRRKALAVVGYGLAAVTKPLFAVATTLGVVVTARFVDRVGKGIRGAPRDALVADLAPAHLRGASFGLRQSLDTVGAFVGPLLAIGLMALTADDIRTVFWIAAVPAALSVAVLLAGVQEPEATRGASARPPPRLADWRRLPTLFWGVVAVSSVLTLARFSEAFLILRAQHLGLAITLVPLVLVVMNIVYSASAYPAGALADRTGRGGVLGIGIVCLTVADLFLAFGEHLALTAVGVVFWGLHMGFTQGLFATLVADTAPADLRGTAFGLFNLALGLAMLLASVLAGLLWDTLGPRATFLAGAGFSALALVGFLSLRARLRTPQGEAQTPP